MDGERIEDIASFREISEQIRSLQQLRDVMPIFSPFLSALGVKTDQVRAALAQIPSFERQAKQLVTLPDRFNAVFLSRGWIMYDMLDVLTAEKAITQAETGDLDGAEQQLVDYYDEPALHRHLIWMNNIEIFRPRSRFLQRAKEDYLAGRYYASVPLVLAHLDGLVNDLSPKVNDGTRRGFFTEGSNLEVWDSIAAHGTALPKLARLLRTNKTKTRAEQNTLPDRNGIMHGSDLGYDNQLVAAKSWAALFATREWALKVEQGRIVAPPPVQKPTWSAIFQQLRENKEDRTRLEAWVPRNLRIGENLPAVGEAASYEEGTPERKLIEFLSYWRAPNYGYMAESLPYSPNRAARGRGEVAQQLRDHYQSKQLHALQLIEVVDEAAALTVVKVRLLLNEVGQKREQVTDFRLIHEDGLGRAAARGKPGCRWTVFTYLV